MSFYISFGARNARVHVSWHTFQSAKHAPVWAAQRHTRAARGHRAAPHIAVCRWEPLERIVSHCGVVFRLECRTVLTVWAAGDNRAALGAPLPKICRPTKLPAEEVAQQIASVPLAARKRLHTLAAVTCIPKSTLARYLLTSSFRRAFSRIKPKLLTDHKMKLLKYACGHVYRPIDTTPLCIVY
jgi:hypothetical protein